MKKSGELDASEDDGLIIAFVVFCAVLLCFYYFLVAVCSPFIWIYGKAKP